MQTGNDGPRIEVTDARRQWREEGRQIATKWLMVKSRTAEELSVIKVLGRGFYGPVKLVKYRKTGHLYAMKSFRRPEGPEDLDVIQHLNNEHTLLSEVQSMWVVKMMHSFLDSHFYFELLEYIPGGSLEDLLQQEGNLQEEQVRFYGAEMLMAINAVHRFGFMHRNVQPCNFLLDAYGHVKIVDFGCSKRFLPVETCQKMATELSIINGKPHISSQRRDRIQIYQRKTTDRYAGRVDFMAPEVVRPRLTGWLKHLRGPLPGTLYSFACDFWSFGVCMYLLLMGQMPFVRSPKEGVVDCIVKWRQNLHFPVVQPVSQEAKDLISSLLCDEPSRLGRAGCEDVMGHVFFEGTNWIRLSCDVSFHAPGFMPETVKDGKSEGESQSWKEE